MAHIQVTDRNPSDLEPMEELTDGELLAINGGRWLSIQTPLPSIQTPLPSRQTPWPSRQTPWPSIQNW